MRKKSLSKPRTFRGQLSPSFGAKYSTLKVRGKIVGIARGPMKLKPTQAHKDKKAYDRKKEKAELKSLVKIV